MSAPLRICLLRFLLPLLCLLPVTLSAQTPWTTQVETAWLHQVLPEADHFSDKAGDPPVYTGYRINAEGESEVVGYAFLSGDIPPTERGYAGPIDMLIGLHVEGRISGLKILDYIESYVHTRGDFLDNTAFQFQFRNKSLEDGFRLGRDVNGISSATVSALAISRGVRNAAHRVAMAYTDFGAGEAMQRRWASNARDLLAEKSWQQLLEQGTVHELRVPIDPENDVELILYMSYVGHAVIGEYLTGAEAWATAERNASLRTDGGEMLLVAVGGNAGNQFRQERISLAQDESPLRMIERRQFAYAGNASEGLFVDRARLTGAVVLNGNIDITRPFQVGYTPLRSDQTFSVEVSLDDLGLALAAGEPILSAEELAQAMLAQANVFVRLRHDPPWGQVNWPKVGMLLIILGMVMAAFLRNDARLRWLTLGVTLIYLGFIDKGFLSISHLTNAIQQGPAILLNNLPLLIIVSFTLITTLIWGRVFCSSLCPFGAVQDIIARLTPKRWRIKVPQAIHQRALWIKYLILAGIVAAAFLWSGVSLFQYFEPFGTLFFLSAPLLLWAILALFLLGSIFIERFYCRYACPLGAALGVISLLSPRRIARVPQCSLCKVCERSCPTAAIQREKIDFKECVRCDLCERKLIDQAGVCKHAMDTIAARHKDWQVVQVR